LIHNNQIEKIKYNSKFQWYDLNNLVLDTNTYLQQIINSPEKVLHINIFPEPIETAEILKIFNINKSEVDISSSSIEYDFKTKFTKSGYTHTKEEILKSLKNFTYSLYNISNLKVAVCIFGEERDLLSRIDHWKNFSNKVNSDFFVALYSNDNIYETLKILKSNLSVKSSFITENNLEKFDQLKKNAKLPIYLYGLDKTATFRRITSQLYIRQQVVSLVDFDDYDLILLCRSDISNFNISDEDIYNCSINKDLIIVNSGNHTHPGGGGGCKKCTLKIKCDEEYHANDVCDLWCIGSKKSMKPWINIYDNVLNLYHDIQSTSTKLEDIKNISYTENVINNEITFDIEIDQIPLIENYIHCYYPEKIMRSAFKNFKILDATHDKKIWQ